MKREICAPEVPASMILFSNRFQDGFSCVETMQTDIASSAMVIIGRFILHYIYRQRGWLQCCFR